MVPGNHDGVHRGHQALLRGARARADEGGHRVLALTFDPHPAQFFAPARAPEPLTTQARRRKLLLAHGADRVAVEAFDQTMAGMSPEAFVRDVLVDRYQTKAIVIGPDFRFGKDRRGDRAMLQSLGDRLGFSVSTFPPVHIEGRPVSSTRIREALRRGDAEAAHTLLGRPHDVEGTVVPGDQRGRTIGFPTANLGALEAVLLPADGVYAVLGTVEPDDAEGGAREPEALRGVANLGTRPTFGAGRSLEAHFFDIDRDLYGRRIRLRFVARIRGEQRFAGVEALVAQIERDAAEARAHLASYSRLLT